MTDDTNTTPSPDTPDERPTERNRRDEYIEKIDALLTAQCIPHGDGSGLYTPNYRLKLLIEKMAPPEDAVGEALDRMHEWADKNPRIKWGDTILMSPTEVLDILSDLLHPPRAPFPTREEFRQAFYESGCKKENFGTTLSTWDACEWAYDHLSQFRAPLPEFPVSEEERDEWMDYNCGRKGGLCAERKDAVFKYDKHIRDRYEQRKEGE